MKEIFQDPQTHNYNVDITVDEWKEILCLQQVSESPNILDALEKWYKAPECTSSCKELGQIYGRHHQYFSVQNIRLGEIAAKYLNRFRLVGSNGNETFWPIAWIEISVCRKVYTVKLRPELVDAISQLRLFI